MAPKCWSDTIEKKKQQQQDHRCLMFMFHSKRTRLIKQLLKARKKRPISPTSCCTTDERTTPSTAQTNHSWFSGSEVAEETTALARMVQLQSLMEKKLKICQLDLLWATVRTSGKQHSGCVLLPRDGDPHLLFCQYFRNWNEDVHAAELRRLPTCRTAADPVYICVNPYHWSRLLQTETPPPPYSTCTLDRLRPEDRAPSEAPIVFREAFMGSLTTSGEAAMRNPHEWCKLAYWEMARRVGPLFPVDSTTLNIFGETGGPLGSATMAMDGLSLHALAQSWTATSPDGCYDGHHGLCGHGTFRYPNNGMVGGCCSTGDAGNDAVVRTRSKIGLGVTLSREENRVWLYNRSDYPVFVNSLSLDECSPHSNPILSNAYPIRLHPGYCMCVYDTRQHNHQQQTNNNCATTTTTTSVFGPVDPNSIRISFGKGWGTHKYSRQEITACPCWLEILLAPCR